MPIVTENYRSVGKNALAWMLAVILLCHLWKAMTKVVAEAEIDRLPIRVVKQPTTHFRWIKWLFPVGWDERYVIEVGSNQWDACRYSPPWTVSGDDRLSFESRPSQWNPGIQGKILLIRFGGRKSVLGLVDYHLDEESTVEWRASDE